MSALTETTLADLPPDIVRTIVPLVEEPFETGMRLISQQWNSLTSEYLNRQYRPIESMELSWTGYDIKIEITLLKSDVSHFHLDQWPQSKLDRKLRNTDLVKVASPDYMIAPKLYIDDCELEVCAYLKNLAHSCSRIRWLSITQIKPNFISPICTSLATVRIKSISVMGIGMWKMKRGCSRRVGQKKEDGHIDNRWKEYEGGCERINHWPPAAGTAKF